MIEIEDGIPPEEDSDDEDMEQEEILDESVKQFVSHTGMFINPCELGYINVDRCGIFCSV